MADQGREPDQRPSPDALPAVAKKEASRAGRLRIFLGAASGVGKTHEMLQEARARAKDGADEMQARALSGPWPAGERLLVCLSENLRAAGLVRYTKRLADRLHGPWTALYVETKRSLLQLSEEERDRIADALRLAQALGGEPVTIPGDDRRIAAAVVGFAQANNVTQIVLGKSTRSPWFESLHGSVVRDLLRCCGNISVHVIAGDDLDKETIPKKTVRAAERPEPFDARSYGFALLFVAVATGLSALLWPWIGLENTDLVYLTAVVGIAVRFGLWPSLVASAASALCYNFFFTEPYYTFAIADPRNIIAVVFFAIVAVVVSNVAARARTLAVTAMARARTTESLYAYSRKLSGAGTLDDVLWASAYQVALMLKARVVVLLPEDGTLAVKTGYPPEDILDDVDLAAAKWAWNHNRAAGHGSDTLPGAKRLFLPMSTGRGVVGIVGIDSDKAGPLLSPDQRRLLYALIDQAALAIERVHLVDDLDQAKRREEADRLRAALLTSLSHDLKTPLASIVGAAGALKDLSGALDDDAKADLAATILEESERLNRFIANLLDMTRLESGSIKPNAAPHDISEIVGSVLERARKILAHHRVEVDITPDLPMLVIDPVLFEQVLFNLLDNAAKYASPETTVLIQSWQEQTSVKLQIVDEGSGIPPEEVDRIFDKFHRAEKQDRVRAGTGLGLAISRGFIEAMGGSITAANRCDRPGAVFTIALPIPKPAARLDTVA
jgi:two-component system sensor histidine kinase KdpD